MLSTLFSPSAVVVEAPIALLDDQLLPEELAYLARAVPKRRAEFGTARVSARVALAAMGFAPVPLVPRIDRSPVWPAGVVGSISHTDGYAAVVLHRSPPMHSLGLDVEKLRSLDESLLQVILTPGERGWLSAQPRASQDDLGLLLFSAKEAFYKCQYPLSTTFLEFQDVELEIDLACNEFLARTTKPVPSSVARLLGKFAFHEGKVFCGVEALG